MELRIALLVLVGLLIGTPSGRARPPEVRAAMQFWRRAVWETDAIPFPDAIPGLQRVADDRRYADDREVLFALAWSYRFVDVEAAARVAQRLRASHPDAPELLLFRSFELRDEERADEADEAAEALERLMQHVRSPGSRVPNAAEIAFIVSLLRGSRDVDERKPEGVVVHLEDARRIARARGVRLPRWAITALAGGHAALRQVERATELLRQAVSDDPGFAGHAFELGRLYALQQRDADALLSYRRAQQLDPGLTAPYLKLAVMTHRAGDLDEMRRWLDELDRLTAARWAAAPESRDAALAAELRAGLGLYWIEVGRRAAAEGDDTAAREAYEQSVAHLLASVGENPRCRRSIVRLVEVGALLGKPQEDVDGWKRALEQLGSGAPDGAGAELDRSFC